MATGATHSCCDVRVDPGEFTRRVRLQSPITTAAGKQTGEWKDEFEAWAKIEPLSGKELYFLEQVNPRRSHKVTTHYRAGIESDWRILYGVRVLHIDRVINVLEANVKLEFLCIEDPQTKV